MLDTELNFTEDFQTKLPEMLGDEYYNDPETKSEPTKLLDNIKNLPDLLKSTVRAQRTISKGEAAYSEKMKEQLEGMIKLPKEGDSEEEIKAYRSAAGVPEGGDQYELFIPETDAEGYREMAALVGEAAIAANVPKGSMQSIWKTVIENLQKKVADMETKGQDMINQEIEVLKGEWNENYSKNVETGDRVLAKVGDTGLGDLMKAYGLDQHPAYRKFLFSAAPAILEGKTVPGGGGGQEEEPVGFPKYEYDEAGKPVDE